MKSFTDFDEEMEMKKTNLITAIVITVGVIFQCGLVLGQTFDSDNIPLPEHPRPDFQRTDWINLNGPWQFRFDPQDAGVKERWSISAIDFPHTIMVPFPWGSKLSSIPNEGDIGWYRRTLTIPESWQSKRVYLVVGASDWTTTAWLDGKRLGDFQGGYTPFEFEMTDFITHGKQQNLIVRVDDTAHPFKLEGKQGYGPARGIWQTVYLEARPANFIDSIHFVPDIDNSQVTVKASFDKPVEESTQLKILFKSGQFAGSTIPQTIAKGAKQAKFDVALPNARLWSLEDPFLYEVDASLQTVSGADTVSTYFGMRKIGVVNLPGTDLPYVALNNKPVYMQLTLDQAYHPDGYYTWPSDAFMRDEILRTRRLGLNGQRIHVKIDLPRKLYWADKLGVLIMADVPNSWGDPTAEMKNESQTALRGMIKRDFNHPAIFSWILFNETWGLKTRDKGYLPETQEWVESIYKEAKLLDPTRLIEDNSPCNNDHVATDMNTWHAYLPGYQWKERLDRIVAETHAGSKANYIGDRRQNNEPMFNSECGNVWGYKGSTGDVDWSWDYHKMINEFRRHPKIAGFLYTEHHDVINEWNGYYRYDRSNKYTGMDELVAGMTIKDLHAPFYISTGQEISRQVKPGETLEVPLFASFMTDSDVGPELLLKTELYGCNDLGEHRLYGTSSVAVPYKPWMQQQLEPIEVTMPDETTVAVLALILQDSAATVLHRNFTTFVVADTAALSDRTITRNGKNVRVIRFAPDSFTNAKWSLKQWNVLDGLKADGAGSGFFEYTIDWPANLDLANVQEAAIRLELSAKQLFGKDIEGAAKQEGDFMRGKGTHDPSRNPNSYPMTDDETFPSAVRIRIAGDSVGVFDLPDDPADHRGILSWHSQLRDGQLREAGSYGYLVTASIPTETLRKATADKKITVRLEVDSSLPGGLAIYGRLFGRYPLDPTLTFVTK
jgi:hypothetical protein